MTLNNSTLHNILGRQKKFFFFLFAVFIIGVLMGALFSEKHEVYQGKITIPLVFSGIPNIDQELSACFITYLLNMFISIVTLFLLGMTIFGTIGVPLFLLLKGFTTGISIMFFLYKDGDFSLIECAVIYVPYLAISLFFILIFGVASISFSKSLIKKLRCIDDLQEIDYKKYSGFFLISLFSAVIVSLISILLVFVYALF